MIESYGHVTYDVTWRDHERSRSGPEFPETFEV